MIIRIEPVSILPEDKPFMVLVGDVPSDVEEVGWQIALVGSQNTEWWMSSGGKLEADGDGYRVSCPSLTGLPLGLYQLTSVEFRSPGSGPTHAGPSEFGLQLFEVSDTPDQPRRASDDLLLIFQRIIEAREASFHEPFGAGPQEFSVFVLFKDVLITSRMRLGNYELMPGDGLRFESELVCVDAFLEAVCGSELSNDGKTIDAWGRPEPTAYVHFPVVRANNAENARELAEQEVDLLIALLSLHRGGAGAVFATVVVGQPPPGLSLWVYPPVYRGNLVGGAISGEEPSAIADGISRLRASEPARLYTTLFREAIREEIAAFKYFRFWSLLETVARDQAYVDKPKKDWQGTVLKTRSGADQRIQDTAEELVFELLRDRLSGSIAETGLAANLQFSKISDLVSIWYRRRNCLGHGGDCLCRNPGLPLHEQLKYERCYLATQEMSGTIDQYLLTLREAALLIVHSELGR